jgi:predicted transcriptional regulator
MSRFIYLIILIALAGGAGGMANYLLLSPPVAEKRNLYGALRFVASGAVAAFVVPLFLSLAQSSLVKNIFDYPGAGQAYSEILIFIGFCVVAGFASRAFMDTMTNKMMQMQREVKKVEEEVREVDKKAVEAIELNEETADRVAEAKGTTEQPAEAPRSVDRPSAPPVSATAQSLAKKLSPQERDVLTAMSRYTKRTQTGVARDARVPRNQVGEIVDVLRDQGVVRFTTSANTGGPRVQLTELGTQVLNALGPKIVITESGASEISERDSNPPTEDKS